MSIYEDIAKEIIKETEQNMKKAAQELLEDANKIVPVDTSKLRSSGKVRETLEGVEVVYDAPHAGYVHEDPDQPGYKFLERTADTNEGKYTRIIGGVDK